MKKILWVGGCLTLITLILSSATASAQNSTCFPRGRAKVVTCGPTYCAPTVYEPPTLVQTVIQPIIIQEKLVPAFSFQVLTAYSPQAPSFTQPNPVAVPQPGGPPTLASGADAEERIALRVIQLLKENGAIKTEGSSGTLPTLDLGASKTPDTTPAPGNQVALEKAVNGLYTRCYSCHNTTTAKSDLVLFSEKNSQIEWAPFRPSGKPLAKGRIYEVLAWNDTTAPQMPPGADRDPAKRVPLDDLAAIRDWDR